LKSSPKFTSFEPLIDLLAYLQPNVWLKTQFVTKSKPIHNRYNLPSGPSGQIWAGHKWAAD